MNSLAASGSAATLIGMGPMGSSRGVRRIEADVDFGDQPWHGDGGPIAGEASAEAADSS